ncbi:hypothetical protein V6Z11_D10G156000 [Gossypium hirsutum]
MGVGYCSITCMDAISLFLMVRQELLMGRLLARMLFFCGYGDLPSFVMPWWFGNQVMAQLKPWKEKASRNRGVSSIEREDEDTSPNIRMILVVC